MCCNYSTEIMNHDPKPLLSPPVLMAEYSVYFENFGKLLDILVRQIKQKCRDHITCNSEVYN